MNTKNIIGRLTGGPADGIKMPLVANADDPKATILFQLPKGTTQFIYEGRWQNDKDFIDLEYKGPLYLTFEDE